MSMASVLASGVYQPVLVLQSRHGAAFQPLRVVQTSCCNSRRAASGSRWAGSNSSSVLPQHLPQGTRSLKPASGPLRAYEGNSSKDPSLEDYVEVRIESVRVSQGASIVYLRVVGSESVIPVHIGENESNALLREINKQRQIRPLTHDLMKNMLQDIGYRVTKVRVTEIIANTYYARVHVARAGDPPHEVDVDARPSDAINLAVRFGAPVYISKKIADQAQPVSVEQLSAASSNETHADIVRSVRETLSSYEDPTVMYQLQRELAVKEERFEDARQFQQHIMHEMTHNRLLRLVVAMESALADGRYEEAAHLRDEYRKALQDQSREETADSTTESSTADQRKLL